ncbi:serine/threonine protein kinase [Burkholderia stagnalis]|uniref:non-specific serine/threonine protein kinase n=1 Tax=Burkholderia stagnalis TaxID=1503054 RepID=A0A108A7R4_9BURK|nr:serine/threonine-protein kinase [Burkholderia stagnalis]KVZ16063.1 serine/threonine protein kinase [Burkholderia stagnalis]KWA44426.1 serine/threonine protein kinase [Burkholderia stagnalis]KWA58135.1 serine/threonine protein kinase [Burkholderia stagnalis]KWA62506.1 serine/threonine protein kinase [Burkholderia stagnalis]KWC90310.1 serine/threonine protein kinase [Burkholderia stagnalis]
MKDAFSRDGEQETTSRGDATDIAVRPLPLGHRLGELQLDEVLGIGGFGIVYRAFDRTLRRAVAIKEYMPSMLATRGGDYTVSLRSERFAPAFDAGRGAFLNEARLLAQFDHPGLVKVLHFWESHGTAYMVMPFYEGRTLKQLLDGGVQMSETQLRNVVAALLGALDTLHRAQCFHRDVALDNVLIRPDGNAILLDFGAARKRIGDLVDDGAMMIKPGYAPIEQYTDDPAFSQGPWTDLYALGAVMHAMITGELPPAAVVRSIKDTYRPLAARERPVRDLYSPGLLAAVDHALQLRIADRPESVAAFAAELGLGGFGQVGYGPGAGAREDRGAQARRQGDEGGGDGACAGDGKAEGASVDAGASSGTSPAASTQARPAHDEHSASDSSRAEPAPLRQSATQTPGAPPTADEPNPSAKPARDETSTPTPTPTGGSARPATGRTWPAPASPPWRGGRRAGVYVGGALAALAAIGLGAAYLMQPARNAGEPASGAGVPQAAAPAPEPGGGSGVAVAQRGPTPIVVPPASMPAAAPVVATTAASEPAAPSAPQQIANNMAGAPSAPQQTAKNTAGASPAAPGSSIAPAGSLDASERVVAVPPSGAGSSPDAAVATAGNSANVFATAATAPEQRPPDTPEPVAVRFHVRPWGDVYVSGVRRGASPPLRTVSLAPGTYQIEIRNGTLPPLRRTVKIDPGSKPISIDYAFE